MSYSLEFTDRAKAEFAGIDVWLQEEIIDELEKLSSHPPLKRGKFGIFIADVVCVRGEFRYYAFLTVKIVTELHLLRFESVGVHRKPLDWP